MIVVLPYGHKANENRLWEVQGLSFKPIPVEKKSERRKMNYVEITDGPLDDALDVIEKAIARVNRSCNK